MFLDNSFSPNFARLNPTDANALPGYFPLAAANGWDNVAVLYTLDIDWGQLGQLLVFLLAPALAPTMTIGYFAGFDPTTPFNAGGVMENLQGIRTAGVRVVFIIAGCTDVRAALLGAKRLDMLEGYAYVHLHSDPDCHMVDDIGWPSGWGPEANDEASMAFEDTISLGSVSTIDPGFAAQMQSDFESERFASYRFPPAGNIAPVVPVDVNPMSLDYSINVTEEYDASVVSYAAHLHDAVTLYAMAADAAIADGLDPTRYENIMAKIATVTFLGKSGFVALDPFRQRVAATVVRNVKRHSSTQLNFTDVAIYDPFTLSYTATATMTFPGGGTEAPPAFVAPDCAVSQYDVATDGCNLDGDVNVVFTVAAGAVCTETALEATAECGYVPSDSPMGKGILAVGSFGVAVCVGFLVWLIKFWNHGIVRLAQSSLALVCMVGCLAMNVSTILTVGDDIDTTCAVAPRIFHLSLTVTITALAARLYRVWRIFANKKLKAIRVPIRDAFVVCAIFCVVDVIILVVSPLDSEDQTEKTSGTSVEIVQRRCKEGGGLLYTLWAMKILLFACTCLLAYGTRAVSEHFAETRDILTAVYQVIILSLVAIVITFMADSWALETLIRGLAVMIGTCGALALIFVPKMVAIHNGDDSRAILQKFSRTTASGLRDTSNPTKEPLRASSHKMSNTKRSSSKPRLGPQVIRV
ncbi:MAG: PBP1 domain-containing GABA-B-like receptor, partial [Planctomycetota bacterium]